MVPLRLTGKEVPSFDDFYKQLGEKIAGGIEPLRFGFPHQGPIPQNAVDSTMRASERVRVFSWWVHDLGLQAMASGKDLSVLRKWSAAQMFLQAMLALEARVPNDAEVFLYLLSPEGEIFLDFHSGHSVRTRSLKKNKKKGA